MSADGLDLDRIEAYCAAATEGPWERGDWHVWAKDHAGSHEVCGMGGWEHRHDGEFIANARTDLPAMVAALRRVLDLCDEEEAHGEVYGVLPAVVASRIRAALTGTQTDDGESK